MFDWHLLYRSNLLRREPDAFDDALLALIFLLSADHIKRAARVRRLQLQLRNKLHQIMMRGQ
jgi:hypothetical protein